MQTATHRLPGRIYLHLLAPIVVLLLAVGVVHALAERGAGICLSHPAERAGKPGLSIPRHCIADLLSGAVSSQSTIALLHHRGNCQLERKVAMMPSRQQLARAPTEQARPTCLVTIRSES